MMTGQTPFSAKLSCGLPIALLALSLTFGPSAVRAEPDSPAPSWREMLLDPIRTAVHTVEARLSRLEASIALSAGVFTSQQIATQKLCVYDNTGETCITKAQLDAVLASMARAAASAPANAPPAAVTEAPAAVSEPSVTVTEMPAVVTEAPAAVVVEPSVPETPAVVTAAPAAVTEGKATVVEPSVTVTEAPAVVTEAPAAVTEGKATVVEPSVTVTEAPAVVTEAPAAVTEAPAIVTNAKAQDRFEQPQGETTSIVAAPAPTAMPDSVPEENAMEQKPAHTGSAIAASSGDALVWHPEVDISIPAPPSDE